MENVYARGKHGNLYVRRRIPAAIRAAYPSRQEHIVRCLGTADVRTGKPLARAENTRIDAEFRQKRQELDLNRASLAAKRISTLDDEQLQNVAKFWVRQVLMNDQQGRQEGLDDAEFDELGEQLATQRAELGRVLAQGKSLNVFPALHSFLFLCGSTLILTRTWRSGRASSSSGRSSKRSTTSSFGREVACSIPTRLPLLSSIP